VIDRSLRHFRLPPFAKNAKDGAPIMLGMPCQIKSLRHPPYRSWLVAYYWGRRECKIPCAVPQKDGSPALLVGHAQIKFSVSISRQAPEE
jgi:hypothetical protein